MASNESSCLIDWNSPVVEFSCKPLIPLPNFDGQVQINGDNPFDDLEMQINENEPFEFALNKSLNSSFEQPHRHEGVEIKNNERKSPEDLVEVLDKMNLDVGSSFSGKYIPTNEDTTLNISSIEATCSDDDIKILKNRLSVLKSKMSFNISEDQDTQSSAGHINSKNSAYLGDKSEDVSSATNSDINKGFIAKSMMINVKDFDSLMCNTSTVDEDLSAIVPVWDETGFLSSSSDEEFENLPTKSVSLESITGTKYKTKKEFVTKKTDVRPPLSVKDPNVRAKKPAAKITRSGPLKAMIPIENMTKKVNYKLGQTPTMQSHLAKKLKADSTSLKLRRRSAPIATSTPTIVRDPKVNADRSKARGLKSVKGSGLPTRSCPPSPDSTTTSRISSRSINTSLLKGCSRKLALNVVSSSTNKYPVTIKRTSKDVKSPLTKSTVTKRIRVPVEVNFN